MRVKSSVRSRRTGGGYWPVLAIGMVWLGCEPKMRPFASEENAVQPDIDAGSQPGTDAKPVSSGPGPTGPAATQSGETPRAVSGLDPSTVGSQSGSSAKPAVCDIDAGSCASADAGYIPTECVPSGPRDCTSPLDNDCDGQPDNLIDDVCRCAAGVEESCDEHPGFDGIGLCRAGTRSCIASERNEATDWSSCTGAIGPGVADSCAIAGDDTDCDGIPNEGCACVDGSTQRCGSSTDIGSCAFGSSTCVNGAFGECEGAVPPGPRDSCAIVGDDANCNGIPNEGCACIDGETQPCGPETRGICRSGLQTCINGTFGQCVGAVQAAARDCASSADNDCNGQPDNTIDSVCRCAVGATQACETHPQDGVGACRAGNQQCSAGPGNSSANFGACTGAVGPAPRNCSSTADNDCDGRPDNTVDDVCRPPTLAAGSACATNDQCSSGRCEEWYRDRDGDGFGTDDDVERTCAPQTGPSQPPAGYAGSDGDCCDLGGAEAVQAKTIFPGQTQFFDVPQAICANVSSLDYDCSGQIESLHQDETARGGGGCAFQGCNGVSVWEAGTPPACGAAGPIISCLGENGACVEIPQGFTLNFCH